jgi:transcription elongation factor GreB
MSRYRPSREKSTPFITPQGHRRLTDELKHLWKVKRPEITRKVAEAAAQGDRSENAEYIYGKRALREIDSRIRFLSKRLDELVVVDRTPPNQASVYFGAWVSLEDDAGECVRYRIVGADEFDLEPGYISVDSPVARALLKKSCGTVVDVQRPNGVAHFKIVGISYDESA